MQPRFAQRRRVLLQPGIQGRIAAPILHQENIVQHAAGLDQFDQRLPVPAESFEVSTRNGVGAKRAVIFCSWASPGAEAGFSGFGLLGLHGNIGNSDKTNYKNN